MDNFETPNTNNAQNEQEPIAPVESQNVAEPIAPEAPKPVAEMTEEEVNTEFNNIVEPVRSEFPSPVTRVDVDQSGTVTSKTEVGSDIYTEKMDDEKTTQSAIGRDMNYSQSMPHSAGPKPVEESPAVHEDNE